MKTNKILFLAWVDPNSHSWFPIGRLTFDGDSYKFVYTQGAYLAQQQCGFEPLLSFPQFEKVYISTQLFPVFSNRSMPRSRPDYSSFIQWLNIAEHEYDPIAILARSGGERETDTLTVFPRPEPDNQGRYHFHFFALGLRHLPQFAIERINYLSQGEKLWLQSEFKNPHELALTLNTEDQYAVGYCPRYLYLEVFDILKREPSLVDLRVERVNLPPIPLQFRLLCHITVRHQDDLHPFSNQIYQPLIELDVVIS